MGGRRAEGGGMGGWTGGGRAKGGGRRDVGGWRAEGGGTGGGMGGGRAEGGGRRDGRAEGGGYNSIKHTGIVFANPISSVQFSSDQFSQSVSCSILGTQFCT